jgi:hypothetical protein
MARKEIITCDRCGTEEGPFVTSVELTIGGNGAAKDSWHGDLCRKCYSDTHSLMRAAFKRKE